MDMTPEEQQDPSETAENGAEQQPTNPNTAPEAEHNPPVDSVSPSDAELKPEEAAAAPEAEQQPVAVTAPAEEQKPLTKEEALAEMRRSLRDEETQEKTGFAASMSRLGNRLFGRKPKPASEASPETPTNLGELTIPEAAVTAPGDERLKAATSERGEAFIEPPVTDTAESQFQSMLKKRLTNPLTEQTEIEPTVAPGAAPLEEIEEPEPEPAPQPEPVLERAVPGRSILTGMRQEEEAGEDELAALRHEALEDYETAPVVEEEGHTTLAGRLGRSWRYMPRGERRLLFGAVLIVALAMAIVTGKAIVDSTPKPTPIPTPTFSIVPFPISVSLPGGWVFPLKIGHVNPDGTWNPQGAEWLEGTEVCRFVSLPWTVQLEAVLRTLKSNDEIKLSMSNYDSLTYKVQSIEQVPSSQISKLANNTPCLLVILSKDDTAPRWVVTSKP